MFPRHGFIVALAAAASLLLHAAVLSSFRAVRVRVGVSHAMPERVEEMTVVFDPVAADEQNEERPKPHKTKREQLPEFVIGESGADGYASHKTEGDRTAVAREAPVDQAALSLDPVGQDPRPETPSPDAGNADADRPATIVLAPPPTILNQLRLTLEPAPAVAVAPPPPAVPVPEVASVPEAGAPTAPPRARAEVVLAVPPAAPPLLPPPAPSPKKRGGADPAPQSDSESDAFSVLGSAQFVNGELRVRAGRKVRSRRPKIGLAGQLDAVYSRVEVTLRVATDETGKVTAVEVAKSSGSNEIDQPCRVSMYDWWFEPKKDAAGNAVPDVFNFTIGFQ